MDGKGQICGPRVSKAEAEKAAEKAWAFTSQAHWDMLDFLLNPTWPEFSLMISSYQQGRRESVPFLCIVEEENESGFGENSHVSPERPEGIDSASHGVL